MNDSHTSTVRWLVRFARPGLFPFGRLTLVIASLFLVATCAEQALAAGKAQAAKETIEYVLKKFGKEAAQEGPERLAAKTESLAVRHGDEVFAAVKKTGPRGLKLIDEAGPNGHEAARLLGKFGDEARSIVTNPSRMALAGKYGDDAAQAMIKHPGIAEPVAAAYGKAGAKAMSEVGVENGRWLAALVDTGELAKIGRGEALLGVVGKYGDRGMDFIYKHRKLLAGAAVLTAFLANPQPYIDGTLDLAGLVGENLVKPIAEIPQKAVLASLADPWVAWTFALISAGLFCGLCYCLYRIFLRPRVVAARLAEERAVRNNSRST
jgi:hypothetical protein